MAETSKKGRKAVTNIQLASQVARDVELESVLLTAAQLQSQVDPATDVTKLATKQQFRSRYEFREKPRRLRVMIAFVFDLEASENGSRNVLHLAAEYALTYRLPEEQQYSPDSLGWFSELNGALNVWPYWRELVHTVVARTGLGSITLPVFRAVAKVVEEAKGQEAEAQQAGGKGDMQEEHKEQGAEGKG